MGRLRQKRQRQRWSWGVGSPRPTTDPIISGRQGGGGGGGGFSPTHLTHPEARRLTSCNRIPDDEPSEERHPAAARDLPARPQHLDLPPALETWLDLGELEHYPSNELPGFNDRRLCAVAAGPAGAPLRRRRARRLPRAPGRRHLDGPRAGARGDRAAQPRRHAHRLRPDAQHLAHGRLPHGLPRPRRARGALRADPGPRPADGGDQRAALRRARRRGRGARADRRLLPRPEHRRHRRRGDRPAHPAHPPERRQPGAARLRRASAASGPPRPTAPARSPRASPATRT
jgi:hypothetical protein